MNNGTAILPYEDYAGPPCLENASTPCFSASLTDEYFSRMLPPSPASDDALGMTTFGWSTCLKGQAVPILHPRRLP